nr:MAG TPA: hypothetical protein [Caudoviricetes sp.]
MAKRTWKSRRGIFAESTNSALFAESAVGPVLRTTTRTMRCCAGTT